MIQRSTVSKIQPALITLVFTLSLFASYAIIHLEQNVSLLVRSLPLSTLWIIAFTCLRGFPRSLICIGLTFYISGPFLRILPDEGGLLAWASAMFLGVFCYSVCFFRYAQWRSKALLLLLPIIPVIIASNYWVTPRYNALLPGMWTMAIVHVCLVISGALHRQPSLLIYLGSFLGLISLALFGLANNGTLQGNNIAVAILPFYACHSLIVFGYIHFQHSYYKEIDNE